jgi:hypothetical protein
MPPGSSRLIRARAVILAVLVVGVAAVGCGASAFDPTGACTADGRAAGAYPDLEALVPGDLDGTPATRVDSGRNCTSTSLGSLASHGVKELRYAGATWETGPDAGVSIAVFDAADLQADWVHEFYVAGAEAARNAESVETSSTSVDGKPAFRVDVLNGESYQTVVDWQDGEHVRAVLVASFIRDAPTKDHHEATVDAALAAAAASRR